MCTCYVLLLVFFFFFFKQKTAYEMRISDWSSDLCSSDLWRLDCLPRVLGKRQLDESRKQHVQALAFEKVRSGNQPVRVTVTLALDKVDRHQQFQLRQGLIERRTVWPRGHGIARGDQHRLDLPLAGRRDLVGQFGKRMKACDGRLVTQSRAKIGRAHV